jgi:hypothetical protein
MIRLNPQQWSDKAITSNLFPPEDNYFTQLFTKKYRELLETNATTDEGMQYVARHYGVETQLKSYLDGSSQDNRAKDYYKLLHIIKTLSNQDFVWISFIEGLRRHAAIIMCLTCSRFDLEDNNIDHNSLKRKLAGVPHYKKPSNVSYTGSQCNSQWQLQRSNVDESSFGSGITSCTQEITD